jgi:hypothetical protein
MMDARVVLLPEVAAVHEASPQSVPFTPKPEHAALLKALLRAGVTMTLGDLEGTVRFSDRTIRKYLKDLIGNGLVVGPPEGGHNGYGLTDVGRNQANQLPPGAGQTLLKVEQRKS